MSLIFQHPHWHSFSQPPPERHFAWGNREGCRRQEGCCLLPSEGQGHCQHALNRYFFFCEFWTLDHKSVSQSQQLERYEKSSSSQLKIQQMLLLYIHCTSWWWFMPTWFGWLCLKSFGANWMRSSEAIRETYGLTLGERSASEVLSILDLGYRRYYSSQGREQQFCSALAAACWALIKSTKPPLP